MMKIPVMIAYFKQAMTNPGLLNQRILFAKRYEGLPVEEGSAPVLIPGKEYTIKALIEHMIIESDNESMALLYENMEASKLNQIYIDLQIVIPPSDAPAFNMNVEEFSRFMSILINATYLDKKYSEMALKILTSVHYNKGITLNMPADLTVAHKYGVANNGVKMLSESGLFYLGNDPYLIVIMTKGKDFLKQENVLTTVSDRIYQHMKKLN
jgi:beta-lactamase class A